MDDKTLTKKTGQARGNLRRMERDLDRAESYLQSTTQRRIVGGAILLVGILALIVGLVIGNQILLLLGVVGLLAGGWMFVRALTKISQVRRSTNRMTGRVTSAQEKLDELVEQRRTTD
jgi:uncharacterized membrane protein YoaK (UPF0700 family)